MGGSFGGLAAADRDGGKLMGCAGHQRPILQD